jgi:hypothetical protein
MINKLYGIETKEEIALDELEEEVLWLMKRKRMKIR